MMWSDYKGRFSEMCIVDFQTDFSIGEMVAICEEWLQEFGNQMPLES